MRLSAPAPLRSTPGAWLHAVGASERTLRRRGWRRGGLDWPAPWMPPINLLNAPPSPWMLALERWLRERRRSRPHPPRASATE